MNKITLRIGGGHRLSVTLDASMIDALGLSEGHPHVAVSASGRWLKIRSSPPNGARENGIHKVQFKGTDDSPYGYMQVSMSSLGITAPAGAVEDDPKINQSADGIMVQLPEQWCKRTAARPKTAPQAATLSGLDLDALQDAVAIINSAIKGGARARVRKGCLSVTARFEVS